MIPRVRLGDYFESPDTPFDSFILLGCLFVAQVLEVSLWFKQRLFNIGTTEGANQLLDILTEDRRAVISLLAAHLRICYVESYF